MLSRRTPRFRGTRALGALVCVAVIAIGAPASALPAAALTGPSAVRATDDPPSWSDVQNAQQNEADTQALIARIDAALQAAQTQSATLSQAALTAAATATKTRAEADAATARAEQLRAQSADADARLADARRVLGTLVSTLQRTESDGPLLARLLTSAEPETLLSKLALLDTLSSTRRDAIGDAQRVAGAAQSLHAQAEEAEAARAGISATAEQAASAAQAAVDAENATVAGLTDQTATLYAQLATLKNTTADVERRYRLAQQVSAQGSNAGGSSGSGGSGGSDSGSGSGGSDSGSGSGSGSGDTPTYGVVVDPAGAKAYARGAIGAYGWGDDQFSCLVLLWNRESGWRANAENPSSGAYGIPQALPGSKMASAGADWRTNGATQVNWGLSYIADRYGSPCGAWDHSERTGWY